MRYTPVLFRAEDITSALLKKVINKNRNKSLYLGVNGI